MSDLGPRMKMNYTLTFSRITKGPATPVTVLYSADTSNSPRHPIYSQIDQLPRGLKTALSWSSTSYTNKVHLPALFVYNATDPTWITGNIE